LKFRNSKLVVAIVSGLVLAGSGIAIAQVGSGDSNTQVIYGCVTGLNGNIVKVSNVAHACPKNTTAISWNVVGPKGDQGIPGPKGEAASVPTPDPVFLNDSQSSSWVMQAGMATLHILSVSPRENRNYRCVGGEGMEFRSGGFSWVDSAACSRNMSGVKKITFLDVTTSNNPNHEVLNFYVLPSICPLTESEMRSALTDNEPAGFLVPDSKPFTYNVVSEQSCLVLMTTTWNSDFYQVEVQADK
jgi:hypothetical protein